MEFYMRRRKETYESQTAKLRIWKIAIYIRLSRDDGYDESLSVTNQRKIILEYLEKFFEDEYELVNIYIDDGKTGTDYERPAFQQMIKDVENGTVNCIVCKTLARAFRNYSDQGYFLEKVFPLNGTRFISIGSPALDTYLNPDAILDGMEVPISGLMNDRYAARTSKDIRRTFDMKRRNGEFIGAFAPYGYAKDPENKNCLIVNEEAAQVVRNIFYWYVNEGMSISGIVRHLNELAVLTPTSYKHSKGLMLKTPNQAKNDGMWAVVTVRTILSNQMYIGNMVQGKQRVISYKVHKAIQTPENEWYIVENTHEAIIDKETFEKAQFIAKRDTRTAPKQKKVYLFSGFLRCAECDKAMTKKTNYKKDKNGEKVEYTYYICGTYAFKSRNKCTRHSIKLENLKEAVLKAIQNQISDIQNLSDLITEINKQPVIAKQSISLEKRLFDKKKDLERIVCTSDSLYMDWKCGDITRTDYVRMKARFEEQANQIKQVISNIEEEILISSKGVGNDDPYLKTFLKYKNIKELNRGILVELIDTIYIYEDNEITIQFKFFDQHKRVLEFIDNNKPIS